LVLVRISWAIVSRVLCGLLNENVGVARSVIGEITDKSNQGKGFSIVDLVVGTGQLLGPLLGGFLTDPSNFPAFQNSRFFINNPYILPCIASASISLVGFILGVFFLDESLKSKKKPEVEEIPISTARSQTKAFNVYALLALSTIIFDEAALRI